MLGLLGTYYAATDGVLMAMALAETRSIDDQIEWLDNSTVLYAVDTGIGAPSIYATAADGSGTPRLYITDADSPSVSQ